MDGRAFPAKGSSWAKRCSNFVVAAAYPVWGAVLPVGPLQAGGVLMLQQPAVMDLRIAEILGDGSSGDVFDAAGVQLFRFQFELPEIGRKIQQAFR